MSLENIDKNLINLHLVRVQYIISPYFADDRDQHPVAVNQDNRQGLL